VTFVASSSVGESVDASVIVLAYRQVERLDSVLRDLEIHESAFSFEVVVVANDVADDVRAVIKAHSGVNHVVSRVNKGFAGGCNLGAASARGRYLVFLNDDASLRSGWLDGLVSVLERNSRVGVVASVLVDENDVVLEAGGAINHRGDVWPPDRGRPLRSIQGRGARRASYATGGSLAVRSDVFADVSGFDTRYHPAYFEDTDLSCRIWCAGHEVWTTTASVVEHAESASTTGAVKRALQLRNNAIFRGRWVDEFHRRGALTLEAGDELPLADQRRVLFIDDRAPANGVGSGAARSRQNLVAIAACGVTVIFHPREPCEALDSALGASGVELLHDLEALEPGSVDAIVLSRPHNFVLWNALAARHPDAMFVYDAEARFSARMERQLELDLADDERRAVDEELTEMIALEREITATADAVVTISTDEQLWFESCDGAKVHWIDPMPDSVVLPSDARRDPRKIVFVAGWEAGEFSPNGDALKWFVSQVVPELVSLGIDFCLDVTGGGAPDTLTSLASKHVAFVGRVNDLDELHQRARVAIAPTRYGAGVKLKTIDALRNGTPVVASTVGAEGIADVWRGGIRVADDAKEFAEHVARLLTDDDAWRHANNAIASAARTHSASCRDSWSALLGLSAGDVSTDAGRKHVAR